MKLYTLSHDEIADWMHSSYGRCKIQPFNYINIVYNRQFSKSYFFLLTTVNIIISLILSLIYILFTFSFDKMKIVVINYHSLKTEDRRGA